MVLLTLVTTGVRLLAKATNITYTVTAKRAVRAVKMEKSIYMTALMTSLMMMLQFLINFISHSKMVQTYMVMCVICLTCCIGISTYSIMSCDYIEKSERMKENRLKQWQKG